MWRITLVAIALQGGGVVFSVGCPEEGICVMEPMVGHADLGLGQGRVSGEGGAGTDVVLVVSIKLGLCGGVMHCKERRQLELSSAQYIGTISLTADIRDFIYL